METPVNVGSLKMGTAVTPVANGVIYFGTGRALIAGAIKGRVGTTRGEINVGVGALPFGTNLKGTAGT